MTKSTIKTILFVEDSSAQARAICAMLEGDSSRLFQLSQVESLLKAEEYLIQDPADIVLLDLSLAGIERPEAVRKIQSLAPRSTIVLLSDADCEQTAQSAMQDGAQDYLVKGEINARELRRALQQAVERKGVTDALFEEKERAQVTLDSIGDAVICTDAVGNVTFLNLVAERLTGWPLTDAEDLPMTTVFRIVDAATRATIANPMELAIKQNRTGHLPGNCILIRRDGSETFIEDSAAPIHDRQGNVIGSVIVFRDVSTARALAEQVVQASQHDALTGLPNRFLLTDRLGQAIASAERHTTQVAVMFLDLDGFKHINDSLGHLTGDKLLQSVASRLQKNVRTLDTVSRQGGDEFVILLPEITRPEDAAISARRLLQAVTKVHSIDRHELHITASIGVSLYPDDGSDAEALMKNADTAMYRAKEGGRQCFKFFTPAMNVQAVERQSIEEDLRHALDNNEFSLQYQPKVDLKSGAIIGAEALLRWKHPVRGDIPPVKFIPVAEASGLILPIGAWVLKQGCTQFRCWVDRGLPVTALAINVSSVQFQADKFLDTVFSSLDEAGLDPAFLELELTESVLMRDPATAAIVLKNLRERGIAVSVDDFGTGYSSLSYLKKLPLDALKIDRSFVHLLNHNPDDAAIAIAIISLGQSLNLRVIAEGVETAEDLAFMKEHNCDQAQGYYLSPPVAPEQYVELLAAARNAVPRVT